MPIAEIIAIGTELLLGEIADTNTRFMARVLRDLGIDLFRSQTIGDNSGRITESVRQALGRADIVITTGGLGPTVDDPTRQAIANSVGSTLEFHPELWKQISERISRYGRTPTENQKRQAYIPKNAVIIENPVGTAPAFIVEIPPAAPLPPAPQRNISGTSPKTEGKKVVISLPGVPSEMETLLTCAVVPYLQEHYNLQEVLKIRTLHVSGLGEGSIDDQIGDLETLTNPTVGLAAHSGVVDIRIAAKARSEAVCSQMITPIEQDLHTRLGINIFGADEDSLENTALNAVAAGGWTLATVESGLGDSLVTRLNHTGHPAYRGGKSHEPMQSTLSTAVEALILEMNAYVVLGVTLINSAEKQEVLVIIKTPRGRVEKLLSYGGHSATAQRWAVNMALDVLRRCALEAG